MSDAAYLAAVLSDGCWHSHTEIVERSFANRGCGLTVHSRAADLRKRGHVVETRLERDRRGRTLSFYRLVLEEEAVASPEAVRDGTDALPAASSSSTPPNPGPLAGFSPPSLPTPRRSPQTHGDGGVLELFACDIDESAGLKGAYWDDAA